MDTTHKTWARLEQFFLESFVDGYVRRELRLSLDEKNYLQEKYPMATFDLLGYQDSLKKWYLVTLHHK